MSKYQAYPKYKDTNIAELSSVPVHWQVAALRRYIEEHRQGYYTTAPYVDDGVKLLRITDLRPNGGMDVTNCPKVPNNDQSLVNYDLKAGDVVFARTGGAGSFGVVPNLSERVVYASYLIRFRFYKEKLHSEFLKFVLQGDAFQKSVRKNIHGGVNQNIHAEDIKDTFITKPNIDEQNQIAAFLDHETAKIDTLIQKQQQLIELLKEKRQAVISHAVTKGLNPDAQMKDSGVEWLGEVPEHWVVSPLKMHITTRKGVAFKSADFCSSGIRVVKASDIKQRTIKTSDVFLPNKFTTEYPKAILNEGEVVLSTVGSTPDVKNSAVGQIGKVPKELAGSLLNQNTVIFSPQSKILEKDFLFYLIQTNVYRDHLDLHAHGTANQASLSIADMLNFIFALPTIKEQQEISSYIAKSNDYFDLIEGNCNKAIALMQERRTALISAAVTGKIDVRGFTLPSQENEITQEYTAAYEPDLEPAL